MIGIPSFIMTLAMMQIAAGISALLVRGQIAYKVPGVITTLGSGSIGGIPWIVIVAAIMLLLGHLVLTYTRFGRYVYMVGGNREAAEYSGLNVKLILGAVMVISAVCSGIGGMLGVAHFGSAQQNEFDTYLLDSIAAVVVGGTSLFGGRGGIGNTIVGLFRSRCSQQRPRPRQHRQLPKNPDPRPDPAGSAGDQCLCAAAEGESGGIAAPQNKKRENNPMHSRDCERIQRLTKPEIV
ncbi:ABC-type xylose transport system permease subunit [Bradyrhizobium sp. GM7.3]